MRILRNVTAVSAAVVMAFSSVSCGSAKIKEKNEIESELEKKYGRNFELIDKETNTDSTLTSITYVDFRDKDGVEFRVTCIPHTGSITPTTKRWEYKDNYISEYLAKKGDEYLSGLKAAGIDTSITSNFINGAGAEYSTDVNTLKCDVKNYAQLDVLFEEMKKLDPPLLSYGSENDIESEYARYYCGDVPLGKSSYEEERIRRNYLDNVRKGTINEQLSDEILSQYPAEELRVTIDGKDRNDFVRKDSESGKFSICFRGRNADEYNETVWISSLESFLVDMGCKNIRSTASGYEWIGGSIDLFNGSFDVQNSDNKKDNKDAHNLYIYLYPEDIEKLFNAKVKIDPVHSCEFKIEKESLLGGNGFVISG